MNILVEGDDDVAGYYDGSTLSRHGKIVTVDYVIDFNKLILENDKKIYSILTNVEYDCGKMTFRVLWYEEKSGHMGEGITFSKGNI